MNSIDLFSGAGGLLIAKKNLGCNILFANEIDDACAVTHRHNFKDIPLIHKDIKDLKIDEIKPIYNNILSILNENKRSSQNTEIEDVFIETITPLCVNTPLYELVLHFKEYTKNHFVPIVDEYDNFLGIIYESDIKKISYSRYGLSLARNESCVSNLIKYLKPIISVEISWGIDKILEMYNLNSKNSLGIFITQSNKYRGFINLNSLLTLSYKRNVEIATNQNPLTKLPGDNQIEKFIQKALEKEEQNITHIIYFDFNDFKPFNDK